MKTELVSVIIPIYNVERCLNNCIDSICRQSYIDLEIILVDDGSTDTSGKLCDDWARKDSRIKVIHKQNGGLSDARNAGIDLANGSWFMFVDGDDTIADDAIEDMYNSALEYDCDLAVCNIVRVYDDGLTEEFYRPSNKRIKLDGNERFETLNQPSVCNKLFKSSLFNDIRFPKGKFYEDTFVYHALLYGADAVVLTGRDGYFYLSRRDSILGQAKYSDRYYDMTEAVYMRLVFLIEHNIPKYDVEACLSMYAVVSNAEKNILKTPKNADKRKLMRQWYDVAYRYLMRHSGISFKQRIRLILLRYCPTLHSRIY